MTILTINRTPEWSTPAQLPVGAVVNLPAVLADPLVMAGEAVPTPAAAVTRSSPFGAADGGGSVTLTAAEYNDLVAGSGLQAGVTYSIPALPALWFATGPSTAVGLFFSIGGTDYIGATALAAQTEQTLSAGTWASRPLTGFTTGIRYSRRMTDFSEFGDALCTWLGGTDTEWRLAAPLRMRKRGAGSLSTSAQYPTNTRLALAAGAWAAVSTFDVRIKFAQSDETSTLTSWRLKLGSTGTATDATILAPTGTPLAATENQRSYQLGFTIEDSTHVVMDGSSNISSVGFTSATGSSVTAGSAAFAGSDTTANIVYLGVDYTMGVSDTALNTTLVVALF